jgi:hypothetical protein
VRILGDIIDRSYVTIVGVRENTRVRVRPTWRIRGNAPIARTLPGGEIDVTLGPFDVLNLETDDGTSHLPRTHHPVPPLSPRPSPP